MKRFEVLKTSLLEFDETLEITMEDTPAKGGFVVRIQTWIAPHPQPSFGYPQLLTTHSH